jgi:FtsZ-interacting cell division protein ZipA
VPAVALPASRALQAVMPFFADEEWREGNRPDFDEVTQDRRSLPARDLLYSAVRQVITPRRYTMQDTSTQIIIVVLVAAVVALLAWWLWKRRTREELQKQFGPEYQRTVDKLGDRGKAEDDLEKRRERVKKLEIRPLSEEERRRFAGEWQRVQARFVDDPGGAIADAHSLVTEVMKSRGYPIADIPQREADLSVAVPAVVDRYRQAREIAERNKRGQASTEDLRNAMVHYRSLFEALLEAGDVEEQPRQARRQAGAR